MTGSSRISRRAALLRSPVKRRRSAAFRACVASERHAAAIRDAMGIGSALGITGTPTFVIGIATAGDRITAQRMIVGAKPYAEFSEALDGALATTVAEIPTAAPARLAVGSSR